MIGDIRGAMIIAPMIAGELLESSPKVAIAVESMSIKNLLKSYAPLLSPVLLTPMSLSNLHLIHQGALYDQ